MRHHWMRFSSRWIVVLLLALGSPLLMALPAHAAEHRPQIGGDSVTLSLNNGSDFIYLGPSVPRMTAVVVFGAPPAGSSSWTVTVTLDTGRSFQSGSYSQSADGMTLTFGSIVLDNTIPIGQRTAIASFYDPGTNTTVSSNPVSFTVEKAVQDMSCRMDHSPWQLLGLSQTVRVQMTSGTPGGQLPADWHNGTFSVSFDGPTHSKFANLTADANFGVTVTTPSQIGAYWLTCAFNGTATYVPVSFTNRGYTVSAMHPIGGVQLFTNPTTVTAYAGTDFYVKMQPAAGWATPEGAFEISIGGVVVAESGLTSAGDRWVHEITPASFHGATTIIVTYSGDDCYHPASFTFSLTNPPIPSGDPGRGFSGGSSGQCTVDSGGSGGSGSSSSGSGNSPQGTATAAGTAAETGTNTPTVGGSIGSFSTPSIHADSVVTPIFLIALIPLLALIASFVMFVLWRRRKIQANSAATSVTRNRYGSP